MSDGELIRRAVRQARAFGPGDLTAALAVKARLCLADAMRSQFETAALATSRAALAAVSACPGGSPIVASDRLASPGEAAFVMGVMASSLLREDMHAPSIGHHGIVVWPALLALAGGTRVSGARLLAAAVVGYEFGGRLGMALFDADLASRLRPTAFTATAGAALAGAYLLGLSEDETVSAVALAVDASAGLNEWPRTGGDEVFFHAGRAAQAAVTAVNLARGGVFGSPSILDGEAGLFAACGRPAPHDLGLFQGEPVILAVYNKALPICNFAQTSSQAALALAARPGFDARKVRAVKAFVTEAAKRYPGCDPAGPYERVVQAKMSIRFGVAAALAHGDLTEARFHALDDAEVARLADLCEVAADPAFTAAFPALQGARVEITFDDGRVVSETRPTVTPATEAEILADLSREAGAALGAARAAQVLDLIDRLQEVADVGDLIAASHLDPRRHAAA
jgi:2-methylcitrate dehydratase PrpD